MTKVEVCLVKQITDIEFECPECGEASSSPVDGDDIEYYMYGPSYKEVTCSECMETFGVNGVDIS